MPSAARARTCLGIRSRTRRAGCRPQRPGDGGADHAAPPWNSYWALCPADEVYVGIGAYKTEPDPQGAVEIAYFTFPRLEGRGIATQMVGHLARIATASGAKTLRALTLPRSSASTSILNRIGFRMIGTIDDPEDGAVWSWSLDLKGNCHER